jgi:deazaflavin-dependent oxidoreductase (nitroreductase family)
VYETPVSVFRRGDTATIALTYGPETEWVKNVLAAGGCELRTRGKTLRLTEPRLVHDERRRGMPGVVRVALRVMGVADFLVGRWTPQIPDQRAHEDKDIDARIHG